jgi:hypothetical protein
VQRWSISRIDLETGTTTVLVPPLEGFDTGNPSLGRAGNRYLTFDAQDVASGNTGVLVMDLFTGQAGLVGSAGTASGYPCFTGDESAVIYAVADNQAVGTGRSLVRQVLTADRLGTQGQPGLWLSDAAVGVIYRRGAFTSTNAVPTVSLEVTPANGSLTAPANLALRATAGDEHGISRVEFYEGSRKLGEDSTPPYAFDWTGVAAGNYRVTARAIDSLGGAADSTAVTVTITAGPPIRVAATRLPGGSVRLVVTATPGSYTIEDAGALGDWHDAFPLSIGATGNASVDDGRTWTGRAARFYRVRKN